jgi:type I restriction enzyme M protein
VPENLRYLVHAYLDMTMILSGARRLKRLREEYWSALFGIGHRIGVGPLPREDAKLLVTRPVEGRLDFTQVAVEHVVDLCARQPYLIQSLCNRIFEHASQTNQRIVSELRVQEAADELVRDNEHMHTLWGYAGIDRRRLVLALIPRLASGPDPVTLSTLETAISELGVRVDGQDLEDDVSILRELELVELDQAERGHVYKLTVPLMAAWIQQHIDLAELVRKTVRASEDLVE